MTAQRNTQRAARRLRLLPLLIGCALTSAAALADTIVAEQWVPGRILVQPRPGLPEAELEKILKTHGGKSVGKIEAIDVHIVQLPENASEKAVAALLTKNPHLKFAELDYLLQATGTANDPYFASAWHLPKVGAPTAWENSTGNGITIAILDSGVDSSHPDLAGKLVSGWNFIDNNSNTADVYGHGTKVAGAAAAASNNALGVASVASGAKIMPLRVTNTSGTASLTALASGLTWAADHGARVANLSFYGPSASSTVVSAAQYMKNKGGLVTVSAGNYGTEATFASTSTMIIVSATGSTDARTSWSSYGAYVDVAAPGDGIWTTIKGGGYGAVSGTSFSAPVTAGAIALMMAANPALAPTQLEQLLFSTAKDLGTVGWDKYYGIGRINAAAAVQAAAATQSSDTQSPGVNLTSPTGGGTVKGLVPVGANASDNVGVTKVELRANGTLVATDITSPYSFTWDSTSVSDGNATLTAYAYDAAGNYSSSSVAVNVANSVATDTVVPVANISNPGNGSMVSGTVGIQGSGSDNVGVASLQLYIDGMLVATATGNSLTYSWNTRKVGSGTHTLRLDARDAKGNVGSKTIQVAK